MRPAHLTPITDAEVRQATTVLKKYPSGLTRADLSRYFGSDRRGRAIMAALTERGIAPSSPSTRNSATAKSTDSPEPVRRLTKP